MKAFSGLTLAFTSTAFAGKDELLKGFEAIAAQYDNSTASNAASGAMRGGMMMLRSGAGGAGAAPPSRTFTGFAAELFDPVDGYGCWCYFGSDYVNGRGHTQDALDEECKKLVNGYRCARMDAKARGEICDASTEAYQPYNYSTLQKAG